MYNKFFFKPILLALIVLFFVSCDKDYNELGASLIGQNHFQLSQDSLSTVKTSWLKTEAIGSNNLDVNALGVLDNKLFGQTTARFATQVQLSSLSTVIDLTLEPEIESVTLYVPYFTNSSFTTDATTGASTYTLDSIYGDKSAKLKLKIYENKYLINNFNTEGGGAPLLDTNYPQYYYTSQNATFNSNKGQLLYNDDSFGFSPLEFKLETPATTTTAAITTYTKPGMKVELNKIFFKTLLFSSNSSTYLTSNALFERQFKGLYFDVEKAGANGVLAMLNFNKGNIVVKYKEKTSSTDATLVDKSITLNLTGYTVGLLNNDFSTSGTKYNSNPIIDRMYVRGGEGSVGQIELFNNAVDVVKYNRTLNVIETGSNGIPDELDYIKSKGWLINEANLTFYVDQEAMSEVDAELEPNRLLLYDINNRRPALDYYFDQTVGNSANYGQQVFGGIVEKDASKRALKYKFRITNYIRNLVNKDSTNVKLGVAVSQVISNTGFRKKQNSPAYSIWSGLTMSAVQRNSYFFPATSVMNPFGIVLYGGGSNVVEAKRLKLKIYYTKPN